MASSQLHRYILRMKAKSNKKIPEDLIKLDNWMQGNSTNDDLDWQSLKTSMIQRTTHVFNNEFMSDVQFVFRDETNNNIERIPAHKFVLSIGSCVFYTMFNGAVPCDADEIVITDIESPAFYTLLRFLYTDIIELIDVQTAISVFYAAKKYMVPKLQIECVNFLSRSLSYENVILILIQARLHDERQLEDECWRTIDNVAATVVGTKDFTDLDVDTLCLILTRNTLNINEAGLFEAVLKWSVAECERQELSISGENQRVVLGRALKLIRFPLMTGEEFSRPATQSGLLTQDEIISIFLRLAKGMNNPTNYCQRCYNYGYCRGQSTISSLPRCSFQGTSDGSW